MLSLLTLICYFLLISMFMVRYESLLRFIDIIALTIARWTAKVVSLDTGLCFDRVCLMIRNTVEPCTHTPHHPSYVFLLRAAILEGDYSRARDSLRSSTEGSIR